MTPEVLLEKFDQLAEAPNAVAKMRELVLQLAVEGRLTEPRDVDESIESFLQRIWADGSDSRSELLEGQKAQPFAIPAHWRWVVLAEIADFSIGKTPPRGDSRYWFPEDHSWVSIADMTHYGTITGTKEGVSTLAAEKIFRHRFAEPGSILMSFKLTIGKVARTLTRCFHNEAIIALNPPEPELANYLFRFLPVFAALQTTNNAIKGSTLNKALLTLMPIALPPLAEQVRIVAKVDELMGFCDRLEIQQQERDTRHAALARASLARFADEPTPANLNFLFHKNYTVPPTDLRRSVLNLAVRGKLVPQDPDEEPAAALLARIARCPRPRRAKEYEPVLFDEAPYDLPSSWEWARLGAISITSDSGWSPQCLSEARSGTDWGVLKVSAVSWGVFKPEENKALPPGKAGRPNCEVHAGDFLLSRANTEELVARSVVVDQTPPRLIMSDKIVRFTFPEDIDKAYVNLANSSDYSRAFFAQHASGTSSSMKNVGREVMCNLPIPLPPLAEQRRIVTKVGQLMGLIDQLETKLADSRNTVAKLLEAVVADLAA